ncbi:Non-specific protein-tyrosine kinase [Aphelenchoides fujianensis]|nr:Non-specific protein-tyrosine kinase [Aphelenchoides fujianensis]
MSTVQLEETLHQALKETDLLAFQHVLVVEKQLSKVEHFDHSYGLSAPAVRRLRTALDRRKKAKKSKLFSSKPKPTRFISVVCEPPSSQAAASKAAGAKDEPSTSSASSCSVQLSEKIGEGTFATVKRGVWQRSGSLIKTECAVKILHQIDQKEWFGQCVGTRKFGRFPYSLVSVKSHRVSNAVPPKNGNVASPSALAAASSFPMNSQGYISRPVAGSLIHAGHGDIDEAKCWGHVDRIDEIYLKNPVVRPPSSAGDGRPRGVSFISSATALHDDFPSGSTANNKVRPVSSVKLDFDPLKAWDMPSAPVIPPTAREKPPAVTTKSAPKPPVSASKPAVPTKSAAFDSVRSEYERLKAERLKNTQLQQSASDQTASCRHSEVLGLYRRSTTAVHADDPTEFSSPPSRARGRRPASRIWTSLPPAPSNRPPF